MFKLYTEESDTFPFVDYGLLMNEAKGKQSVLEIGPGYSTFAFIEAEVPRILTLENLDEWFDKAKARYADHPSVEVRRYEDEPEATGEIGDEQFDLAFVDSPKGYPPMRKLHVGQKDCNRFNTCVLALKHAPVVILHDACRTLERATLGRLGAMGHRVSYIPGSTGMARIERNEQVTTGPSLQSPKKPRRARGGASPKR